VLALLLLGTIVGIFTSFYHIQFDRGAGDVGWPLCGARALLDGNDPYEVCIPIMSDGSVGTTNPLTPTIAMMPFVALPNVVAVGLVLGLSTALLFWALLQQGQMWRLLVLVSGCFWFSVISGQWSPLMLAVALFSSTLSYPLTMIKPQLGLPIALMQFTWRRALICVLILGILFLYDPFWMLKWLSRVDPGDRAIPLLVLPLGPLLLLALWRWRTERARWLLLYALMPQRFLYDQLVLFLFVRTRREALLFVLLSWLAYFGYYFTAAYGVDEMLWIVGLLYMLCLGIVLREPQPETAPPSDAA
jgi:hypothetical protein